MVVMPANNSDSKYIHQLIDVLIGMTPQVETTIKVVKSRNTKNDLKFRSIFV